MKIKDFTQSLLKFLLVVAFLCTAFLSQSHAAADYGIGRIRTCNANGEPDGLNYNPTTGGKDVEFIMSNPVCISVVAYAYATVKIGIARMNHVCGSGSAFPRATPSPVLDVIDIGRASIKAVGNASCASSLLATNIDFFKALAILGGIYGVAVHVYDSSEICGANWIGPNTTQYINSSPNYKAEVENAIFGNSGYIKNNRLDQLSFNNKIYREWYYGGVEIEGTCPDVSFNVSPGEEYPPQKYYMRGLETANFNCKKYDILPGELLDPKNGKPISSARLAEYRAAYDCCKRTAREYVCIKYAGETKFCKAGSLCEIKGITFSAKSIDNGRFACAETYSLCPYNFAVGGGSEACDYYRDGILNESSGRYDMIKVDDVNRGECSGKSEVRNADCTYNAKAGRCKNYCQFMRHCTKTDLSDYQYVSNLTSAYFSSACLNFVGDSQNKISFGTGFIAGSARHFSAPIAQCTKETIENIFYNRAGHTACKLSNESPSNESCAGGELFKKGENVIRDSFFSKLQFQMRFVVKLILTLSITFFGAKILIGGGGIKKSELMMYIFKIGMVFYFATGEAWQTMFFDGVYGASTVFSQMVFKIQTPEEPNKRDGCQFGNVTLADNTVISVSTYPQGKEYLAIWDTLDCKITRYLGFGPELSTANIAKLILAGWITGPIGIYFSVALLFFGLVLISIAIRALHIFLSSCIAIILMVYVSPLIIPLVLFEKTKGIFKGWLTQIISFSLQPMILFAYIAILISLMDTTLIGSATFYGEPPSRAISCSSYCQDALGQVVDNPNCDQLGQTLVVPKADSIACMIDNDAFANWPGLEVIGISLPFLIDFFLENTREKILTIAKAVLVMYFLLTFMDEIPAIASQLLGGAELPGSSANAQAMFKSIAGALKAVQKRANRGGMKALKSADEGAQSAIRKIMEGGDKGKSVSPSEKGSGGDSSDASASPKGGGGDSSSKKADTSGASSGSSEA